MSRQTQGLLLAFLGAVLVRLSLSDAYLRYVTEWMKWPILASGLLLIGLAIGPVVRSREPAVEHATHVDDGTDAVPSTEHRHSVPLATWLLVLPGLVAFVVAPPELGSYLAERRAGETAVASRPDDVADLDPGADGPVDLPITEFTWRAQADPASLTGAAVTLTGFASYDRSGDDWYVTRLTIGCCAADAIPYPVRVDGADRPGRDQWVEVTGVHVKGTGEPSDSGAIEGVPAIEAQEVVEIDAPVQTYE